MLEWVPNLKRVANDGRRGVEYQGPCPMCVVGDSRSNKDRFHVWPSQNNGEGSWWCRGCPEGKNGGDAIAFLMLSKGCSFKEAAAMVGRELKKPLKPLRYATPVAPSLRGAQVDAPLVDVCPSQAEASELWQARAKKFVADCRQHLRAAPRALAWLQARGLTAHSIEQFNLGYQPEDPAYRPRKVWGLPEKVREDGKVIKMLWVPRGIVIPNVAADGQVRRIRVRQPKGDPKYYVVPGGDTDPMPMLTISSTWPGLHQALVVVESELDACLIAQEVGDRVSVMALGSDAAKPRHPEAWLMVQQAVWLGVCLDRCPAGDKSTAWWLNLASEGIQATVEDIRPQHVKDPGELLKAGIGVRQWLLPLLPESHKIQPRQITDPDFPADTPEGIKALWRLLAGYKGRVVISLEHLMAMWKNPTGSYSVFRDPDRPEMEDRFNALLLEDEEVERYLGGLAGDLVGFNNLVNI